VLPHCYRSDAPADGPRPITGGPRFSGRPGYIRRYRTGVRVQRLQARRSDPAARSLADAELRLASVVQMRLTQEGWWN